MRGGGKNYNNDKLSCSFPSKGLLDDTAFLPPILPNSRYAVSMDTLVEGVHTFADTKPQAWAYKLLAANLSDMAAQAAKPLGIMLSLSLARATAEGFIKEFAPIFAKGCAENDMEWLGGDLTNSPANTCISATIFGAARKSIDPRRSNAKPGDAILLTGSVGLSALGLRFLRQRIEPSKDGWEGCYADKRDQAIERYNRPISRWREALMIGSYVNSMMDLSDGLASDLPKLCAASNLGARVWLAGLLEASCVSMDANAVDDYSSVNYKDFINIALNGGEDFELLITADIKNIEIIKRLASPLTVTQIGVMNNRRGSNLGINYIDARDEEVLLNDIIGKGVRGYDHFS